MKNKIALVFLAAALAVFLYSVYVLHAGKDALAYPEEEAAETYSNENSDSTPILYAPEELDADKSALSSVSSKEILNVLPKEKDAVEEKDKPALLIPSATVAERVDKIALIDAEAEGDAYTSRTKLRVPMKHRLIRTQEEYSGFLRRAKGRYPKVNFTKNNILVLETANDLPDNVLEIVEIKPEGKKGVVTYRVNIMAITYEDGNSHTYKITDKKLSGFEFEQVL